MIVRPSSIPVDPLWLPHARNETHSDTPDTVTSGLADIRSNWFGAGDTWYAWLLPKDDIQSGFLHIQISASYAKAVGANFTAISWKYFLKIYLMETRWTPSTLTWNNQPALSSRIARADYEGAIDYGSSQTPHFNVATNWHAQRIRVTSRVVGLAVEIGTPDGPDYGCHGAVRTNLAWTLN